MEDTKIITKEQLDLTRNLATELLTILETKRKLVASSQEQAAIESALLSSLKDKDEELYNAANRVLGVKIAILRQMQWHQPVEANLKKSYVAQADILKGILKSREKEIENAEKIKKGWEGIDSQLGGFIKKSKGLKESLNLSPKLYIAQISASIFLYTLKQIYNVFDQLDSAAADFRKSMGITRIDSVKLESDARAISISLMSIGVSAKDVYNSIKSIADEFGSSRTYSLDMVSDMATLTAQFSITGQTSSKFVKSMAMVSGSTASTQKNMLMIAQRMSAAAGVPLDSVMNDVASASQESYQFLSKNPLELLKAAVKARELGTTLSSATKTSASLLDFTKSVSAEMEASVLLGKSMNLQKARELAYHRDIAGLNTEIVRLAKEANFEQLDAFQAAAVANALGKSAGEVASMLESDREHSKIIRAMTPELKKQYDEMMKMDKSKIKDYAEMARQQIQTMSNQKAITAISAAWSSIFANLGSVIFPAVATILTGIAELIKFLAPTSKDLVLSWMLGVSVFKLFFQWVEKTSVGIKIIAGYNYSIAMTYAVILDRINLWYNGISKSAGILKTIVGLSVKFGAGISKFVGEFKTVIGLAGKFGKVLMPFVGFGAFIGKWLTPIGWVITAFQFIYNLFKELKGIGDEFNKGFWHGMLAGLLAVGRAIYDTLLEPFVAVGKWIWKHLGGHSPSEIGLGILRGIQAVGGMLINALLFPYKTAWKVIQKLPFISHLFGNKNIGIEAGPEAKAKFSLEKSNKDIEQKKKGGISDTVSSMGDDMAKRMGAIVDAINALRDDMKNGTLTANVYLDSQKLDTGMGRRLKFTGTLA